MPYSVIEAAGVGRIVIRHRRWVQWEGKIMPAHCQHLYTLGGEKKKGWARRVRQTDTYSHID